MKCIGCELDEAHPDTGNLNLCPSCHGVFGRGVAKTFQNLWDAHQPAGDPYGTRVLVRTVNRETGEWWRWNHEADLIGTHLGPRYASLRWSPGPTTLIPRVHYAVECGLMNAIHNGVTSGRIEHGTLVIWWRLSRED